MSLDRRCSNCSAYVDWGVLCSDCVRASVLSFASGLGAALTAWLLL